MEADRSLRPATPLWRSYALLALVMLLWSGNMIVGRAVRGDIPPFTLAFVRWTIATLVALPIVWRHIVADRSILLAAWPRLLLLGLTGVAAFNSLIYSGLRHTTASNALLLQAAIPTFVLVFNLLIFRQKSVFTEMLGVVFSTVGVASIVLHGTPANIMHMAFNPGDLLVLLAVICWAAYTSLLRIRPECHASSFLIVTFAIGIVVTGLLAMTEVSAIAQMRFSWRLLGGCVYVALFPSLIAYALYNAAVAAIGAAKAGQTISLMPLFGSLLAAALLGEQLHSYHFFGMALILSGIVTAALPGRSVRGADAGA